MAVAVGRIGREERLSTVEHLDELRARLLVSAAVLAVAFGACLWQNHALLRFIDRPLARATAGHAAAGTAAGVSDSLQRSTRALAVQLQGLTRVLEHPGSGLSPASRASLAATAAPLGAEIQRLDASPPGRRPVTLGIGEPFTTTVAVAFLFALTLSLPVLLFELYGFVAPALGDAQRRVAKPVALAAPLLFAAGVSFGYLVVLPAAVHFLQNFNAGQFEVLVQASQYYRFAAVTLLAMGLLFQVPLGIVAVTSSGLVSSRSLRRNRRYALLACAAVAALLPGDAVTMLLETAPLYVLFEAGVLLASIVERRAARRAASSG